MNCVILWVAFWEKDERPTATGLSNFILTCTARQRFQLSGFAGVFILTNNRLQINTYHETKHQVWSSHPDPSTSLAFARSAQDDVGALQIRLAKEAWRALLGK